MVRTVLLLLLAMVIASGCAAPQRSGGERATYLTMATASGGFAGGLGTMLGCHFVRYGLSHGVPDADAKDWACLAGGALLGGGGALYGSLESESEPDLAQWVTVSLGTAVLTVALGSWLVDAFD